MGSLHNLAGYFSRISSVGHYGQIRPRCAVKDAFIIAMGLLILGGIVCILAGLFLTLLAVHMLEHPGYMGVEMVLAPIIGLVALGLFALAGFCMYWASRVGKRSAGEQPKIPIRP